MQSVSEMKSRIINGVLEWASPDDIKDGVFQCDAITEVAPMAFEDCKDFLTEVILNNVVKLHRKAFFKCQKLEAVYLPQARDIKSEAFFDCRAMKKCILPHGKLYGDMIFDKCDSLEILTLHFSNIINRYIKPKVLIVFGAKTADDKKRLHNSFLRLMEFHSYKAQILFITEMRYISLLYNDEAEFMAQSIIKDGELLHIGTADIKKGVFENTKVTSVGLAAYYRKNGIKEVILPNAAEFQNYAFYGCSMEKLTAPNLIKLGNCALFDLDHLTQIELPNATELGRSSLSGCSNLVKGSFPQARVLQKSVFSMCKRLKMLTLHYSVKLDENVFTSCLELEWILLVGGAATEEDKKRIRAHLPDQSKNVRIICVYDLWLVKTVLTRVVPQDLASLILTNYVFHTPAREETRKMITPAAQNHEGWRTKESVITDGVLLQLGNADIKYGVFNNSKVISVSSRPFMRRVDIKEVILPNAIEFQKEAFFGCSMEKLVAPKLQIVEEFALALLANLTEIALPNLKHIENSGLLGCRKLRRCSVPKLKFLPMGIFENCNALEALVLHHSVELDPGALKNCNHINLIVLVGGATREDKNRVLGQLPQFMQETVRIRAEEMRRPAERQQILPITSTSKAPPPPLPPRKKREAPKIAVPANTRGLNLEGWYLIEDSSKKEPQFFKADPETIRANNRVTIIEKVLKGMKNLHSDDTSTIRFKSLQILLNSEINSHLKILTIIAVLGDGKKEDKLATCIQDELGEKNLNYLNKNALPTAQKHLLINSPEALQKAKRCILDRIDDGFYTRYKIEDNDVFSVDSRMEGKNNLQNS